MRLPIVNRQTRRLIAGVLAVALLGTLGGCGKRPGWVDPPKGVPESAFPRTYPHPSTDPKP